MESHTATNNNMTHIDSVDINENNRNINENSKLSSLYDHELGSILHNENIFETNDTILNNEHNDVPLSKTQIFNATTTTNDSNNNNFSTDDIYSHRDTAHLVDISEPGHNNTSKLNGKKESVSQSMNSKNDINRSNSNSVLTDNASLGTIEDIINPAFMKPTVLNNNNSNNKRSALMLARDFKSDMRNFMRMGSPLNMFNSEHVSNNDLNSYFDTPNNSNRNNGSNGNRNRNRISRNTTPLYSTDIIRNSIVSSNNNPNYNQNHSNVTIHRRHNQHKTRPAFINKLWNMVNDENNKDLIQWADDGNSFFVKNREIFVHEILPRYFKHSNFASFVRQLNMYGWHKVQDIRSGSIQGSSDDKWQFANENFIRGREDLLVNIVRQRGSSHNHNHNEAHYNNNTINDNGNTSNGNNNFINANFHRNRINNNTYPYYNINQKLLQTIQNDKSNSNNSNALRENNFQLPSNLNPRATLHITNGPESIQIQNSIGTVLNELEQIKYNQIAISKDLLRINKDNELLWEENMMARERYRSQQQILEKIFRFMAAIMPHLDQKMITDGLADKDKAQNNNINNNNGISGMNPNSTDNNNITNNVDIRNNPNMNTFNKYRSGNMNMNDHTNSVSNGIINYGSNNEINPQITTPSENESIQNGVYLETIEDINNTPPEPMLPNHDVVNIRPNGNNSKRNDRLLLKNKVTYTNNGDNSNNNITLDDQQYNTMYPNARSNIYINNDVNHSSNRISEIPFRDEGADNNTSIIQEVNSNTTSPQTQSRNGNIAEINAVNKERNDNNNTIFARLQDNIEEQDNRIHHLEDMMAQLTPKLMSPMPILDSHDSQYSSINNPQFMSNQNNFEDLGKASQDYYSSHNNDSMIPDFDQNSGSNHNNGGNKTDTFNLQDYLTHEDTSHQEIPGGMGTLPVQHTIFNDMSPLMMEEPQFLLNEGDSNHINTVTEVDQPAINSPQIEELPDINVSHGKRARNFSSTAGSSSISNPGTTVIGPNSKRQKK